MLLLHPAQLAVGLVLVALYWFIRRQDDEARAMLAPAAWLINICTGLTVALFLALFIGTAVVKAQGLSVPWPDPTWCQIYWFFGIPYCWF